MKFDFWTYHNFSIIATGQIDDYTTGCLLDSPCFKERYMMIAIDWSKQQALDLDPETIQQISFTRNLAWNLITEEEKQIDLDFS